MTVGSFDVDRIPRQINRICLCQAHTSFSCSPWCCFDRKNIDLLVPLFRARIRVRVRVRYIRVMVMVRVRVRVRQLVLRVG